jgi:signal transduction histidine kinase
MLMDSGQTVVAQYLFSALNLALGLLLITVRWRDRVARLLALGLLGTAATFNHPSHAVFHVVGEPAGIKVIHFTFHVVSGVAYMWAVILFPDGRLPLRGPAASRTAQRILAAVLTVFVVYICWHSSFIRHPPFFVLFFGIVVACAGFAAQTARLHPPLRGTAAQQAQSRLLRSALVPAMLVAALWLIAAACSLAGGNLGTHAEAWMHALAGWFPAVFAVVPVVLFVGILRYRLWEIDGLLSRTLLYGLLVGFATVAYVLLLGLTGDVVASGAWASVLAMTAVALAAEPVRVALRRLANRLVFGHELTPAEALRELADGLERLAPASELQELARVVVLGTRAVASARVWLVVDDSLVAVAAHPPLQDVTETAPRAVPREGASLWDWAAVCGADRAVLVHHEGQVLGALALTLHRAVELTARDERLLDDLGGHAGLLVRNAQLTAELARHVERLSEQDAELRRSRLRLVEAQDAERQRLERDIHDGAQQELVAVLLSLRRLTRVAESDPEGCLRELPAVTGLLAATTERLRELSGGNLPGVLVDGGLGDALAAAVPAARQAGLDVALDVDLDPRPPLDVESAVYFCCLEALQNAAKHAQARTFRLRVGRHDGQVTFEAIDDGAGFDPDAAARSVGLRSMAERLSVLGGMLTLDSEPGGGTRVRGTVPVGAHATVLAGAGAAS